jgi:heme-degrading monooxygenase HmoA
MLSVPFPRHIHPRRHAMYGTVARMRLKAGAPDDAMAQVGEDAAQIPGLISSYVYRSDDDPRELFLAVVFESREAYVANAERPEQHERYLKMRELLEDDPEWHDGEVVHRYVAAAAVS